MRRPIPYLILFVVAVLSQIYVFDNLALSVYLTPLVYIAFILLLPIDMPPVVVLLLGLATGVTMDYTMGAAGVNTIATLLVSFLRITVIRILCNREDLRDGGIPSVDRLGKGNFLRYLIILVFIHHFTFFLLESLTLQHIFRLIVRVAVSGMVSILYIWVAARLFTTKLLSRL